MLAYYYAIVKQAWQFYILEFNAISSYLGRIKNVIK